MVLSLTPSLSSTLDAKPPQIPHWDFTYTGAILLQRQALGQSQPFPTSPHHPVPHLQLHSKAPPGPVWEKVNWKSPFPHHLVFSFHTANWSIIHLLWQSSALGTKLSGGAGFHGPPSPSRTRREGINVLFCSRMNRGFSRALTLQTSKRA